METNKTEPIQPPLDNDAITNADESNVIANNNPDPLPSQQTDADIFDQEYEGKEEAGNVGAENEWDAEQLDGSTANNLRTK
ncbi:hypothetical protein [Adhaeribacter pallidiroseus]|uniref:Uncharacterized protein n=1 Tax=Adhaeribacter pallidiroseus TaxID=2072847 RepID=A0A369QLE2_9BACT|nr:hypothetical protein [Adhaeribacter pallidiroseus]RDC64465.1 hypothetical protein AHMF7616_03079 [Adhaeribacter pallidiroseus]